MFFQQYHRWGTFLEGQLAATRLFYVKQFRTKISSMAGKGELMLLVHMPHPIPTTFMYVMLIQWPT